MNEQMIPAMPPHKGFFPQKKAVMPDLSPLTEDVGNLSRRVRVLEESFSNMRRALQVTEQNMLDKNKLFSNEIRALSGDVNDLRKEAHEIKDRLLDIVKELESSAKREDVKILEKYINLWNPIKFVTQNEIDTLVTEIVARELKEKEGK